MKNVLIIGNCHADFIELQGFIEINFKAKTHNVLSIFESKKILEKNQSFDLILINNSGYFDHKPGTLVLDYLKEKGFAIPVLILSNKKEAIQEAVAKGAKGGFDKDEIYTGIEKEHVLSLLRTYLS